MPIEPLTQLASIMNCLKGSIGWLLIAVASGCSIDRTPHGFTGEVVSATGDMAIVDAESDQGLVEIWPFFSPIGGSGTVVRYRLFFSLNRANQRADLFRIENGWSDQSLPNSINIGSGPALERIRHTPFAIWVNSPVPPLTVMRRQPLDFHVHDAQKIDCKWVVLTENNPKYGDWTLIGPKGLIATANKDSFNLGTLRGPDFYAWDLTQKCVLFTRGVPGSNEVDVWSYDEALPNVTRYELHFESYFEWQGKSYCPRREFKQYVH